jgi:hypothetical protein
MRQARKNSTMLRAQQEAEQAAANKLDAHRKAAEFERREAAAAEERTKNALAVAAQERERVERLANEQKALQKALTS